MADPIALTLPPNDPRIHVFALTPGRLRLAHQTFLSRLKEPADATPLTEALGAPVDTTYAEVFSTHDIAPMELADYLAQAHDIAPDVLDPARPALGDVTGDVVVLAPWALAAGGTLTPHPDLRHVTSLAPAEVNDTPVDLPPAAKEPSLATPGTATGRPVDRKMIAGVVLVALVLVVVGAMLV